jgi:predicted ArsR family transcriptional regulator
MNTSRNKILAYLQAHPAATVEDLSVELATRTLPNIRYHLQNLLSEGMIVQSGTIPSARRGRPVLQYSLNPAYQNNNLGILSSLALDVLFSGKSPTEIQVILEDIAEKIVSPPQSTPGTLTQRFTKTVEALNKRYYAARWEARPEGPRILFGHCPYTAILQHHPELCQMDRHILSQSTGRSIEQLARIGAGSPINPYCIFVVKSNPEI